MTRSSALKRPPAPLPSAPAGESGTAVDRERRRGRGAQSNASGRYEPLARVAFDDGWQGLDESAAVQDQRDGRRDAQDHHPQQFARTFPSTARSIRIAAASTAASIVSRGRPTPISGCRPGLDFESKLFMKPNAPELLERELSAPGYVPKIIAIGTNTDPYQPIERRYQIMRRILEVLERAGHPVGIVTKSALVLRDLDILARMAKRDLVKVAISVTTLDAKLARTMEPRASTPPRRLEALRQLVQGRRADLDAGRAGHSGDQRRRDRAHSRCGGGDRRAPCRLCAAAPAARSARPVPRMADGEFSRPLPPRVQAHPRHARRQGLRFDLRQAHDRRRPDRLDDRPAVRSRLRTARLQRDQA